MARFRRSFGRRSFGRRRGYTARRSVRRAMRPMRIGYRF